AALDPTELAQSLHKGGDPCALACRRTAAQEANGRQLAHLLRACLYWPSSRCAAEQSDELAPLHHSMTSSARASSVGGTVRSSAFAVLRLSTNSYLMGACTGRAVGLSPLRMRST